MSAGFFGKWEPVDTNKPQTTSVVEVAEPPVEQEPVVTDNWPQNDSDEGFPPVEEEPVVEPSHALAGAVGPATPVKTSATAGGRIVQAARGISKRSPRIVMAGIAGPPKAGKSGGVMDSLTDDEIANGAEIWHMDYDLGGESTKSAHHRDKAANIVVINPWVLAKTQSRVPQDFPASFQRALDILQEAAEQAERQNAYYAEHGRMPNPYLKTLVFDGADHWLNICETVMKIEDLELGVDGIAVAGQKTTTKIGRFNWNIRKNRYNSAMMALMEIARRGVHCYFIAHMKPSYDSTGNEIAGAEVPNWLSGHTEAWLQQIIEIRIERERDESGALTGRSHSVATLTDNRQSLHVPPSVVLFEKNSDGGVWHGWKGLRDGSFEHPDDVLWNS